MPVYDVHSNGNTVYVQDVSKETAIVWTIVLLIVVPVITSVVTFFISQLYTIAIILAIISMIVGAIVLGLGIWVLWFAYQENYEHKEEDRRGGLKCSVIGSILLGFGIIVIVVANNARAPQLPEFEMKREVGLLSFESSDIPLISGEYVITSETKKPMVCITNERGYGPDTDITVTLDTWHLQKTNDEYDKKVCWDIRGQDHESLADGNYTLVLKNHAGIVKIKVTKKSSD